MICPFVYWYCAYLAWSMQLDLLTPKHPTHPTQGGSR